MTEAVRRLGKYEVSAEIGKGGFATVYRARDLDLGREVALKVLDPLLTRDPAWVARFRREARAVAMLDHPRIVTVHEIGQSEGALFIAMKLVEGGSLAQRLTQAGPLPWEEAVRMVGQIAEGLDFAHDAGVLHRDLKPANVLLDGRTGAVLTDFGFARLVAENSLSVSMSGGLVGTPATMAPEVWEGASPTAQADVYALGCILYEMVAGQPLFSGATPPAVMLAHFKPLMLPDQWSEGTPPGLDEVLQTALARDPAARYPRAGDLAAAVAALSVDRLAEPYAALQAAVAGQQWPEALALAGEIKANQPDYRDVAALERQALAGLEQAARTASASQWRATAEEALADGDLAAAQLALKQWQAVMPEDPALTSVQERLQAQREAPQAAEERERESKAVAQETMSEQPPVATPPPAPVGPPVAVASAERPPSRGRSAWPLLAVGALAVIVVLALALRGGGEQPGTSVAFVETPAAASAALLSTDTPAVPPTATPVPPTPTPIPPTSTPVPQPMITSFSAQPGEITPGQCVSVNWSTSGGTAFIRVFRNGTNIQDNGPVSGSIQDCLNNPGVVTYQLQAFNVVGALVSQDVRVNVIQSQPTNPLVPQTDTPAPPIVTPSPSRTPTPRPTVTPTHMMTTPLKAIVWADNVVLRAGPGKVYDRLGIYNSDTPVEIIGKNASDDWSQVRVPAATDVRTGWIMTEWLSVDGNLDSVPVVELPADSDITRIFGFVNDSLGKPIDGINVAIWQGSGDAEYRQDAYSNSEGYFQADVPINAGPVWNVEAVGISCSSRIMDPANCSLNGYFELSDYASVAVPQSQPILFVYEKANTVLRGNVPRGNTRVIAERSDGARSWGTSSDSGDFELPISDGSWEVYSVRFDPRTEGQRIRVEVTGGNPPAPISLTAP
jgi:serine/threonine-protein kinase